MKGRSSTIRVDLGLGSGRRRLDLRPHQEYVAINGDYRVVSG